MMRGRVLVPALFLLNLLTVGCSGSPRGASVLTSDTPIHLEDHLDVAAIEGSEPPETPPEPLEWRFEEGAGGWLAADFPDGKTRPLSIEKIEDGIRLDLTDATSFELPNGRRRHRGAVYVDLPELNREDWAFVAVRARTADSVGAIGLHFNLREPDVTRGPFEYAGEWIDVINDGSIHTYIMRADWSWDYEGPWRQLGITFGSRTPSSLDLLSVSVIPKAAKYAAEPVGVATEARGQVHRRVLYTHAPGRLDYQLKVPEDGRLDVGLGVLRADIPVRFSVHATVAGETQALLDEVVSDKEAWAQRSVDLSNWGGRQILLTLETESENPGTVALWAAPTVSGTRATEMPNVILYVIDAGGAEYMSVYGYNRPTTPNLDRLAQEGVVFEYAYSNSSWSKTSTPSFATSLHHSVLGGYKTDSDPIPDQARTMAEHLHAAGYQTAVIVSNAYAGTMSSLDRGADFLRDEGAEPNSTSSVELHDDFWGWRETSPGEPYFVHFQTTDVHWPWKPASPFAGMYLDSERREQFYEWERALADAAGRARPRWLSHRAYPEEAYETAGVDRIALFDAGRALYDETMAHQDWQIGRLVERLKAVGEWDNTLLIVAADHGNTHGLGVFDPLPGQVPNVAPHVTRIPLIISWPARIAGGQRFPQPVSMIDVLPTVLDIAGLPMPEVQQGQSLAPLLLGRPGWEERPVLFDEFYVDWDTGALEGALGMIDGRWGAVLRIAAEEESEEEATESKGGEEEGAEEPPVRLKLYDRWNDPFALNSVHEEYPDLAEEYETRLEELWEAHLALAQRFSRTGEVPLTPEQLQTLRSLGYIQ
jgi:arylsulfatase A-like enzyme